MASTKKTAKPRPKKSEKGRAKKSPQKKTRGLKLAGHKPTIVLMSADAAPSQFNGVVHYQTAASFLVSGGSSLLVRYRPQGNYTPADVGAAASYLRHTIGKNEGDPALVLGYSANQFGQPCILMIAAS